MDESSLKYKFAREKWIHRLKIEIDYKRMAQPTHNLSH